MFPVVTKSIIEKHPRTVHAIGQKIILDFYYEGFGFNFVIDDRQDAIRNG